MTAKHLIAYAIILAALLCIAAWRIATVRRQRTRRSRHDRINLMGDDEGGDPR
jgi:hypothetical protein